MGFFSKKIWEKIWEKSIFGHFSGKNMGNMGGLPGELCKFPCFLLYFPGFSRAINAKCSVKLFFPSNSHNDLLVKSIWWLNDTYKIKIKIILRSSGQMILYIWNFFWKLLPFKFLSDTVGSKNIDNRSF